jgi:histidinol-phosphate aminotransferase
MGHPDVIQLFNNVKAPYNISQPTSAIASKALEPQSLLRWDSTLLKIQKDHADLSKALLTMRSVASMRGGLDANFLLVRLKSLVAGTDDTQFAELMYKRMAEHRCTNQVSSTQSLQNVVVRFRGREHGCEGCLRVTVGTSTENADLLSLWRLIEDEIIRDFA